MIVTIDFETYSEAGYAWDDKESKWKGGGLPEVGMARYAEHPSTQVLCMAYGLSIFKDSTPTVKCWVPSLLKDFTFPLPVDLFQHIENGGLVEAWNAGFEFHIWNKVCVRKYGWPPLPAEQLRCAAARARIFCIPGRLEKAGDVLNLTNKKNPIGKRLIDRFSKPRKPTKNNPDFRIIPFNSTPLDKSSRDLLRYNIDDVNAEIEASSKIPDFSALELESWQFDQTINRRGVAVDVKTINCFAKILTYAYEKLNSELTHLTEGKVTAASQIERITNWANGLGCSITSLTKEHVEYLLTTTLHTRLRRVLEIRQLLNSAAVKKFKAMQDSVCADGRIRELFIFHSARTGRTAGVGVQPQNLPNNSVMIKRCTECKTYFDAQYCPECVIDDENIWAPGCSNVEWNHKVTEQIIEDLDEDKSPNWAYTHLQYRFENPFNAIGNCLRGMFIAAPDHVLIGSDYSAIEAVILAMLAKEQWRIDVFRSHGKIYEASASKITGTPLDEILGHKELTGQHHPLRKLGKIAELASGYQGWMGAWKNFGADKYFKTDEEIINAMRAWRDANKNIAELWHKTNNDALNAITAFPGQVCGDFFYNAITKILTMLLPSGRFIYYHNARIVPDSSGRYNINYDTWNTNPLKGAVGWVTVNTYGGKLVENKVQAIAYDILVHAIKNLEAASFPIVLQVHDELVAEVAAKDLHYRIALHAFESIMSQMPDFAKDWPIRAQGGWVGKRYRK